MKAKSVVDKYNFNKCGIRDCKGDCKNIIPFNNLLNVPKDFLPKSIGGDWDSLKISIMPSLNCIVEPCIEKTDITFNDPCNKKHVVKDYELKLKKLRVVGSINYIISAQYTASQLGISDSNASISGIYTMRIDRILGFVLEHFNSNYHVSVGYKDLQFDSPEEFVYGEDHALKIKGNFIINVGNIVETLRNGSFENAFADWNVVVPTGASAETVFIFEPSSTLIYRPIDECYFALLKTDGPGSYTTISQTFAAKAGDKIEGWAFFKANDYLPFNDNSKVRIKAGNNVIATPFNYSVSDVGDYGHTPWTYWSHTFTADGTFTIEAQIANALDSSLDSYMGLDAIRLIRPII
ncbi:hypothetical protein [Clostridium cibarium]|uniref:Uncharacterized protein n=1 Tax=Clostridium cibarium TaxID=2762247 RepID=A0ABR8PSN7_9CLOT|nr:hypothetical protein [Clostridium cibarium]MBD7911192.1 hypothetical protein [Clostridium cibarium]